jgi:mRNA-degrading endonuclease toxin of MazEF toxin-antitoxin module
MAVRIPFAPEHAQGGDPPAVIVQNDPLIASLPAVLMIPFTSTQGAARFPDTLVVPPDIYRSPTIGQISRIELWSDRADRLLETVASSLDIRAATH